MTCSVCRYYFCYICNGPVGTCYCDAVPIKSKWLRRLVYIFLITLFFMAIPMILLLATPIGLVIFVMGTIHREYRYSYSSPYHTIKYFIAVPSFMILFYVGCLLNVVAIPIILTLLPFFVCYLIVF